MPEAKAPLAGNGHSVAFPQKPRPSPRQQVNERDYSVYQVDPGPSFPGSFSNDAVTMEDTDIRMQKKLNAPPPGKQQKGFISKFFNRDRQ